MAKDDPTRRPTDSQPQRTYNVRFGVNVDGKVKPLHEWLSSLPPGGTLRLVGPNGEVTDLGLVKRQDEVATAQAEPQPEARPKPQADNQGRLPKVHPTFAEMTPGQQEDMLKTLRHVGRIPPAPEDVN